MRRLATVLTGTALLLVLAHPAAASWTARSGAGGAGRVAAVTLTTTATPTATVSDASVTLSWTATTSPPATGYTLRAFDAVSGIERPLASNCAGLLTASTCTEVDAPNGQWRYRLTAHVEQWTAAPSDPSAPAFVGNP